MSSVWTAHRQSGCEVLRCCRMLRAGLAAQLPQRADACTSAPFDTSNRRYLALWLQPAECLIGISWVNQREVLITSFILLLGCSLDAPTSHLLPKELRTVTNLIALGVFTCLFPSPDPTPTSLLPSWRHQLRGGGERWDPSRERYTVNYGPF